MPTTFKGSSLDWTGKVIIRVPHKFDPVIQYREWWKLYHTLRGLNPNIIYGDDIIMAFDSEVEAVEFKLKYL